MFQIAFSNKIFNWHDILKHSEVERHFRHRFYGLASKIRNRMSQSYKELEAKTELNALIPSSACSITNILPLNYIWLKNKRVFKSQAYPTKRISALILLFIYLEGQRKLMSAVGKITELNKSPLNVGRAQRFTHDFWNCWSCYFLQLIKTESNYFIWKYWVF